MQIFNITKAATAAAELFETIDRTSSIDPMSTSGVQPDDCVGNIELQDVAFSYSVQSNLRCPQVQSEFLVMLSRESMRRSRKLGIQDRLLRMSARRR